MLPEQINTKTVCAIGLDMFSRETSLRFVTRMTEMDGKVS